MTCYKLAKHLGKNVIDEKAGKFFEEVALLAVYKTFSTTLNFSDLQLLISEMPSILLLNYPVVENIRSSCMQFLAQVKDMIRHSINDPNKMLMWREFTEYDYLMKMLQTFDKYEYKN